MDSKDTLLKLREDYYNKLLGDYKNKFFDKISKHKKFNIEWLSHYPEANWNFKKISRNPHFDISWIDKYPDKEWDFEAISEFSKNFNISWVNKYPDKDWFYIHFDREYYKCYNYYESFKYCSSYFSYDWYYIYPNVKWSFKHNKEFNIIYRHKQQHKKQFKHVIEEFYKMQHRKHYKHVLDEFLCVCYHPDNIQRLGFLDIFQEII